MIWADAINIFSAIVIAAAAIAIATNANSQGLITAFFNGFNGSIKAETQQ